MEPLVAIGSAFELYTGDVLRYLPAATVYSEREMRVLTEAKICDYLAVGADFLLFVECKAVKYSATLVSEGAVKRENSTRKVAGGWTRSTRRPRWCARASSTA